MILAKQIQFLHLWGQVVVCSDIQRSKKDLEPFAMLFCVCFDVLQHLQKPWPKHSKTVTAIQSIKSLAGTRRGMRHGQQLQLVVPGCRGCYQGPQYRSIAGVHCLLSSIFLSRMSPVISCHVMNIWIQLLSPKTSSKPKLRQLKITHWVQRCFVRVLHSGTYL